MRRPVLVAASLFAFGLSVAPPAAAAGPVSSGSFVEDRQCLSNGDCETRYELDGSFAIGGATIDGTAVVEAAGYDESVAWPGTVSAERFTGPCQVRNRQDGTVARTIDCYVRVDGGPATFLTLELDVPTGSFVGTESVASPLAEPTPRTEGIVTPGRGDCDPGACVGQYLFAGTFVIGGTAVDTTMHLRYSGPDEPTGSWLDDPTGLNLTTIWESDGPIVSDRLSGSCHLEEHNLYLVAIRDDFVCSISLDGGPSESVAFEVGSSRYSAA